MPDKKQESGFARNLLARLNLAPAWEGWGERPDFRFKLNGLHFGLEVTRNDPEETRRGRKIWQESFPGSLFSPTGLDDTSMRRRSNPELLKVAQEHAYGDYHEYLKLWAERCAHSLVNKLQRLNSPDYLHFDENWLLVTGLEGPSNNLYCHEYAFEILQRALIAITALYRPAASQSLDFNSVYFLFEPHLFVLDHPGNLENRTPSPETILP